MKLPMFQCGDVVCELGQRWFGRAICWFTRGWFEPRTWTAHSGRMIDAEYIGEALGRFTVQRLDPTRRIKVWRYRAGFSDWSLDCMRFKAAHYAGKSYGWWKNAAHALDGLLQKLLPVKRVYLFRRLIGMTKYPICSWEVAWTLDECAHVRFGCPPNMAAPDDIADYCESHPDEWELVYDNVTGARHEQRVGRV